MNPKNILPLIVTDKLAETKKFYVQQAGFELVTEMEGYLSFRYGGGSGLELSFMTPGVSPIGERSAFDGNGLVISIPTRDADAKAGEMTSRGVTLESEPTDRPWGWRSFTTSDPNGVILDFFHVPAENAGADAKS